MHLYCLQRNICPRFFFAPFVLVVSGQISGLANSNVPNYLFDTQACLGEFKTVQNNLQVLKAENNTEAKITLST